MKRIFSTLIPFLFSLSCFSQDGFTAIMPAVRPINGLLIPDNAMTNPEKLILMDTFKMANIRFSLTLYDWPHAITAYSFWINNGKKVILNVNYECASLPCPWPTNMVDYSNKMTSLLNTLPVLPDLFAIENEEFNDQYHTGPISDYITELQTAAALIHARGKKVINGGIGGANGSMDILVYRYLKATHGQAIANAYGAVSMRPFQVTAANNPGSNPALDAEADTVAMVLTAYKDICDYINFHDLYEPINPNIPDTTTALTPLVLKYRQEYVAAFTKKAFITNETGQKNLSPSLASGMLQRYIDRNLTYVVWYDGDGTGGAGAQALNDPTGLTLRYNGNAYRKFFGGDTAGQSQLLLNETFEQANYFSLTDPIPHKIHSIENCNANTVSPDNTTSDYGWTLTRTTSRFYQGAKAAKIEIRKNQPLVGTIQRIRSEVTLIKATEDAWWPGPEVWYSYALYIPSTGFDKDSLAWDTITQWSEDGGDDCTVKVRNGRVMLQVPVPTYNGTTITSMNNFDLYGAAGSSPNSSMTFAANNFTVAPINQWHVFVFHILHSWTSNGLIEVWRDGIKLWTLNQLNMHTTIYPKWKIGIYKSNWTTDPTLSTTIQRILYFDNVRIGKPTATYSDMVSFVPSFINRETAKIFKPHK